MPDMGGCLGWVSMLPHCFNGIAVTGRERLADVLGHGSSQEFAVRVGSHRPSILRRSCLTFDKRKVQGRIWRTTTRLVVRAKKFREALKPDPYSVTLDLLEPVVRPACPINEGIRKWMEPCCDTV